MAYSNAPSDLVDDYANLRTIPAFLGILFALSSLYQFGAFSTLTFAWFEYTLTDAHAMLISLGTMVVAFASSETKSFDHYEDWEKVLIAAGPVLIVGHQHIGIITDLIANNGMAGGVAAVLITLASWGVAVR